MKNSLVDLNNHLFAQIEKLGDDDFKGEKLEEEIRRADSMIKVAHEIVNVADTVLQVAKLKQGFSEAEVPEFLLGKKSKKPLEINQ